MTMSDPIADMLTRIRNANQLRYKEVSMPVSIMKVQDRFIGYTGIHSTSSEESGTHPSFEGEWDMLNTLKRQMEWLEVRDIYVSEDCYIYGTIPATPGYEEAPALGFLSHMDTSPDAKGRDVKAVIHENYDGGDIEFPAAGTVMKVSEYKELELFKGETLITSDGTTLLGADDKAGIAEILTAVSVLKDKDIPHGTIYIAFTPDEEIGEGTDGFEMERFPAAYAYTVDGGDVDTLEYECFNAATAVFKIHGISVHTGDAKNKMINAANVAHELHGMLPKDERPENTEGKEGFFHLHKMSGEVSEATLIYLVRDHDTDYGSDLLSGLGEYLVERFRLRYGAWESVEKESVNSGDSLELRLYHAFDDLVRDELAGLDETLCLKSELRSCCDLLAQERSCTDVMKIVFFNH